MVRPEAQASTAFKAPAVKVRDEPQDCVLNPAPSETIDASARAVARVSEAETSRCNATVPPQPASKLQPPAVPWCSTSNRTSTRSPATSRPPGMEHDPRLASDVAVLV